MIVTQSCKECQAEYNADTRELNRGNGIFCSRSCSGKYNGRLKVKPPKEPNVKCSWCGTSIYRKQTIIDKSKTGLFFCTTEHQNLAYGDPKHPLNPGPKPTGRKYRTCSSCLKKMQSKNSICYACVQADRLQKWLTGDITVTWQGVNRTCADWVKKYLIETRGDKCEVCDFVTPEEWKSQYSSIITMDHIDGNYLNNDINNLKLLCPNCHAMTPTYGSRNKNGGREHRLVRYRKIHNV